MRFRGRWQSRLVLLLLAFGVSGVHAQSGTPANCVSQSEMREIAQTFRQFRDLAEQGEYCLDGSPTANLVAGILFMRKTRFAAQMPSSADELFSGRFSQNWYEYFIGRIDSFDIQDSCPKGVGAFVYFFASTMYVCPMLLTENFTALDRASVFMHEARHIDGFPHVTCSRGPREGLSGACDESIGEGGSYAVTVETYAQLARYGDDLHPALRAYARASAITYADEAFESVVQVRRQSRLLLMSVDQEFHVLSTSARNPRLQLLGPAPELGHIIMRGQHMILFPDDRTRPARFVFARGEGEIQQQAGDFAVEYNSQTPQLRSELVDLHVGAQWMVKVFRNKLRFFCDPRSEFSHEMNMEDEIPTGLIYPTGYDRGSRRIHLATESGRVFEVGCGRDQSPHYQVSNLQLDQRYKRVHKVGDNVIGLTQDGRLFQIEGGRSVPLPTQMDGRIHEMVPNYSVEFFDSI
ncbi:MAG: hypothetical protein AB7G93_05380 [Bdellovibrionales bacterium]